MNMYTYMYIYIYIYVHCSYFFVALMIVYLLVYVMAAMPYCSDAYFNEYSKPPIFHYHPWTQWMDLCQRIMENSHHLGTTQVKG